MTVQGVAEQGQAALVAVVLVVVGLLSVDRVPSRPTEAVSHRNCHRHQVRRPTFRGKRSTANSIADRIGPTAQLVRAVGQILTQAAAQQHRSQPQPAVLGTWLVVAGHRSSQDHNRNQSSEGNSLWQCEGVTVQGQAVLVATVLVVVGLLITMDH